MSNDRPEGFSFPAETPPPPRNGYRSGMPSMDEFIQQLDMAEGVWFLFHIYKTKQSGYQRASDSQKKYGERYEFVARNTEEGTKVFGRKLPYF